jgi:hypothetical protein
LRNEAYFLEATQQECESACRKPARGVGHAATRYDALFILKRAIEDAGSLEKSRVREALERLDMPALTMPVEGGRIRFDEHHGVRYEMFVTQLTRDAASGLYSTRIIWPADVASATLQLPKR